MSVWGLRGEPHVVYRAYAPTGLLLYVGCTHDIEKRMKQHRSKSVWFDEMARYTTTEYLNFYDARAAEDDAIYRERPVFNRNGGGKKRAEDEARQRMYDKWAPMSADELAAWIDREREKEQRLTDQIEVLNEAVGLMEKHGLSNLGEAIDLMNEINA